MKISEMMPLFQYKKGSHQIDYKWLIKNVYDVPFSEVNVFFLRMHLITLFTLTRWVKLFKIKK